MNDNYNRTRNNNGLYAKDPRKTELEIANDINLFFSAPQNRPKSPTPFDPSITLFNLLYK